jgi:predicted small lipoprotein YifL
MTCPAPRWPLLIAAAACALTLAASGCGLKGALSMPSQSEEIVIRPAAGTSAEGAVPAAPAPAGDTAAPPVTPPAEKKITPKDERLPPPPLPGGNPGTARSG